MQNKQLNQERISHALNQLSLLMEIQAHEQTHAIKINFSTKSQDALTEMYVNVYNVLEDLKNQ